MDGHSGNALQPQAVTTLKPSVSISGLYGTHGLPRVLPVWEHFQSPRKYHEAFPPEDAPQVGEDEVALSALENQRENG